MSSEVAKLQPTEVAPSPTTITTPNAVECIMEGLKEAIGRMDADDVSVELSAHQEGQRSSASFRLRAYRNGRKVVNKSSRDEDDLERE
jgi:hypothetical protein